MPWTLWRAILKDVWKLVLLSTAVLVAVIAFAATVKPLAEGKLAPLEALRFMLLAIPPMLSYALPFAACFGLTLAYHRMVTDNEFIAARASGISQRAFLVPAIVTGLVLALALGMLNEQVIPRFLRSMESMIRRNLIHVMVRSIERGEAAEFADLQIYAERVRRVEPEKGSGVLDQYVMGSVTAIGFDQTGRVETDLSARQAFLWLVPASVAGIDDTDDAVALIRFTDWQIKDRGGLYRQETFSLAPVRVPSPLKDDPKFLTSGELVEVSNQPERINWIDAQRVEIGRRIAAREAIGLVVESLRRDESVRFDDAQGRSIAVRAAGIDARDGVLLPLTEGGAIEVEVYLPGPDGRAGGGGVDRLAANSAVLEAESPEHDPTQPQQSDALRFVLRLEGVRLLSAAGVDLASDEGQTEQAERQFRSLRPPRDTLARFAEMDAEAVIVEAGRAVDRFGSGTESIRRAAERLDEDIAKLRREIIGRRHERLAMAVSCLVMVLTGAVSALRLRDALPLVVYLWCFLPALLTVITINTGSEMMHRMGWIGIPVIWAGVGGLGAYAIASMVRVGRH